MTSDAQKRATEKYDKANTKQIIMKLNKGTDADILKKLEEVGNVQGYIKELIRKDIREEKGMKGLYILIDDCGSDTYTECYDNEKEAIMAGEKEWNLKSDYDKKRSRAFYVLKSVADDIDDENSFDGDIVKSWTEEKVMEAKYWIDTEANGGFVLYKKTENDEAAVLSFTFEDVPGSKELEEAEKIGEAWELIDRYIESKLGFLPDYEVN